MAARKVPVYISSMTVTVAPDGRVVYYKDIYGRDARMVSLGSSRHPQLVFQ